MAKKKGNGPISKETYRKKETTTTTKKTPKMIFMLRSFLWSFHLVVDALFSLNDGDRQTRQKLKIETKKLNGLDCSVQMYLFMTMKHCVWLHIFENSMKANVNEKVNYRIYSVRCVWLRSLLRHLCGRIVCVYIDEYEYVERMMWKCVNPRTKVNGSDGNCSYMPHSAQRDTMCIWRGKKHFIATY